MADATLVLAGPDVSFPIAHPSQLAHAFECLFKTSHDLTVVRGEFIFKREPDSMALHLISAYSMQPFESRIQRALDFIQTHYEGDLSLSQIARAACLSPSHFCRLFRREMGMSLTQYLNHFRLTRAKQLLSETDFSITRVCFDVGFNSLTHFERVFKHIERQSPSEYRKAIQPKKVKEVAKKATDVEHFSFPHVILKESMTIGEKHAAG